MCYVACAVSEIDVMEKNIGGFRQINKELKDLILFSYTLCFVTLFQNLASTLFTSMQIVAICVLATFLIPRWKSWMTICVWNAT
jgi:hypothetical protein